MEGEVNIRQRMEDDSRRQRGLPVAGNLEVSAGTSESIVVGSSYPAISKSNRGAPLSGYALQARLAAGTNYRPPEELLK